MTVHLDDRLSAYLDGELSAGERAAVEAHLADCEACRAVLDDLKRLVRRASALDDRPPAHDLWPGIAARIQELAAEPDVIPLAPRRRRVSFSVPQLAAAALALMALSGGVATLALRGVGAPTGVAAGPDSLSVAQATPDTARSRPGSAGRDVRTPAAPSLPVSAGERAVISYDTAIVELQHLLASRRGELDTSTVRVLEQSLHVIDQAIAQARSALARDPNNPYLNGHLQQALDRKLDLLRQAVLLPAT
jgi:anti-sigma factor RsiW